MCGYALKVLGLPFDLNPTTNQGIVDNSEIVVSSIPTENLEKWQKLSELLVINIARFSKKRDGDVCFK